MSSNQGQPDQTSITMPDDIAQSGFLREKGDQFQSAVDEIRNQGQAGQSSQTTKPLIQRVPPVLYKMKEDFKRCFEPRLVSLGPLHHGKPQFERAEKSKLKFAAVFALKNGKTYDTLFNKVMAEIKELRKCYDSDDIKEYDDEKLAWMLFVDGCTVLCTVHYGIERMFEEPGTKADLLVFAPVDLFLLENQIPYRVLGILIESAAEPEKWKNSITEFIAQNNITNVPGYQPKNRHSYREDYAHLLERLREELLSGEEEPKGSSMIGRMLLSCGDSRKDRKTFRSIRELKESGIDAKPTKTGNLKNIFFSCNFKGKLMMPRLMVDDSTASKFLNLVALEMCRDFNNDFAITSYLNFLDSLIDTADDVKELRVTGMLHNYFGSNEEVVDLFSKMTRDLMPDQQAYFDVRNNIHKYCNNPLIKVYYTHFSRPWTIIAPLGAIIGLLLSAIQTYLSLQQNKQRSD